MSIFDELSCEIIPCKNREHWLAQREKDITSTESAALFHASPYLTEFELWHQKKGSLPRAIEETEPMRWGNRLQDSIGRGIAADKGWEVASCDLLYFLPGDKTPGIGSSLDFIVRALERGPGILEVKNVGEAAFRRGWMNEEEIEAPAHIEIQVQHQLEVTGLEWAAIGALVGGHKHHVLIRERNSEFGMILRRKIDQFWRSIESNLPPDPAMPDDAAAIRALYAEAEPGKSVDLTDNNRVAELCALYHEALAAERMAKESKEALAAELLTHLGHAERASAKGYAISAKTVPAKPVSFTRAASRPLRITKIKTTGENNEQSSEYFRV